MAIDAGLCAPCLGPDGRRRRRRKWQRLWPSERAQRDAETAAGAAIQDRSGVVTHAGDAAGRCKRCRRMGGARWSPCWAPKSEAETRRMSCSCRPCRPTSSQRCHFRSGGGFADDRYACKCHVDKSWWLSQGEMQLGLGRVAAGQPRSPCPASGSLAIVAGNGFCVRADCQAGDHW